MYLVYQCVVFVTLLIELLDLVSMLLNFCLRHCRCCKKAGVFAPAKFLGRSNV
jgi:hypothetical protein